jgi:formylmethanofuran dehydrogenase subunit C
LQADDNVTLGSSNADALVVNATADFNDIVNIDGNLDANNGIDVTSGDLNVTDNATITGNTRVDGNFQFDAAGQAVNNIRTDVRATGFTDNVSLVTETGIRGAINSSVTADNGLNEDPDGNIQLGGLLLENTTITNNGFALVVDGANGDLTVASSGNVTLDGTATLTTNDQVDFNGNADANSGLDVTGGALTVDNQAITQTTGGQVTFAGNVDAGAGVDVTGLLQADDNVTLGSSNADALVVNATADFNDIVNVDGNLDANNGIDVTSGDLNVTDNATITGTPG